MDQITARVEKENMDNARRQKEIDAKIQQAAPDFPVGKINKTDLAVLRLATYELLIEKKEPQNVIIDEAVELAKEFGNDTSPAFINGVLGSVYKEIGEPGKDDAPPKKDKESNEEKPEEKKESE